MELYQIILLTAGLTLFVAMIVLFFLKKDYMKYSKLATPILKTLTAVLKAVGNIFPNSKVLGTISTVISAGVEAAGYAENLWLQGEIDKTKRPQHAQQYIQMLLEKAGIEITSSIETIISGVFAITCYLMPHYSNSEEQGE